MGEGGEGRSPHPTLPPSREGSGGRGVRLILKNLPLSPTPNSYDEN